MLSGPLAAKRQKEIRIKRREGPDDDAPDEYILGSDSKTIKAVVIPVISDDVLLPSGPVLTDAQFVAYIDEETKIRTGDVLEIPEVTVDGIPQKKEKILYVIGVFPGENSQRLDLSESRNFMTP